MNIAIKLAEAPTAEIVELLSELEAVLACPYAEMPPRPPL